MNEFLQKNESLQSSPLLQRELENFRFRSQRKCAKSILTRILAISAIIFIVLLMTIIYHCIVVERMEKMKQIISLNIRHQQNANILNTDKKSFKNIHLFRESDNAVESASVEAESTDTIASLSDEKSINLQHMKMRKFHYRSRRDITYIPDPLHLEGELDLQNIYGKIRYKRTRSELFKLEQEYIRCKKETPSKNDCMVAFAKMYRLAKEISDKMEKMKEIFKESDTILEESDSKSFDSKYSKEDKFTESNDNNNNDKFDKSTQIKTKTINTTTPNPTRGTKLTVDFNTSKDDESHTNTTQVNNGVIVNEGTTEHSILVKTTLSITTDESVTKKTNDETTETSDDSQEDIEKLTWILDGNDSIEASTTKIPSSLIATDIVSTTSIRTDDNTTESLKISWIIDGNENDHIENIPLNEEKWKSTELSVTTDGLKVTTKTMVQNNPTTLSTNTQTETLPIATKGATEREIETETDENLRKSNIEWILDDDEYTDEISSKKDSKNNTGLLRKFSTEVHENISNIDESILPGGDNLLQITVVTDETVTTSTENSLPTIKFINSTNVTISYQGACALASCVPDVPPTPVHSPEEFKSRTHDIATVHPLDNPNSSENMLDSFERHEGFKTVAKQNQDDIKINETHYVIYDSKKWEKVFKETSTLNKQSELIENIGDLDANSMLNLGPKVNPINTNGFGADTQLLTLCERMAKRLQNKENAGAPIPENGSETFTHPPAAQFTSRGPGGFPVTGETMKASAQFMFNPNFGPPTIPICFYVTPANFRMFNQPPMWSPPYVGSPANYGGSYGYFNPVAGGGGGGGGVFFVPQNFGPSGNFFGPASATGGGSQANIPNIFSKHASPQKKQHFFCTYMPNQNNNPNQGVGSSGTGSGVNNIGFSNANFKMRMANQSALSANIIYASFSGVAKQLGQKDQFKCSLPGQVACYGGNECINEESWCDNAVDCSDGSDESACTCRDRMSEERICDGYADCPMGEDEMSCLDCGNYMFSCYDNANELERYNKSTVAMCYSAMEKCDGVMHCMNGKDERDCSMIVKDLSTHMSHAVSASEGYLYRNHRGEWYAVCNNGEKWAKEACDNEGDHIGQINITFQSLELPGPFIEPTSLGNVHFAQSCQKRDSKDVITDHATYVKCAATKCGITKTFTTPLANVKSKRSSKRSNSNSKFNERIVGGTKSEPLQWPFVVAIYRNGNFLCGGSIYSEYWIISAAHCAINFQKYHYEVRAGMLRRTSFAMSTQIQSVTHIVVHQLYDRLSMKNDLSLFRLAEPLKFNRWVKPICLPDVGRTTMGEDWVWGPEDDVVCTVVGWGAIREKGPSSDQLREVRLPMQKRCKEQDDQEAEDVCAGDTDGGRDACQGDSGGPLFCPSVSNSKEWYLAGIVSHGNGCARSGELGAYTRVALYLDWIEMGMRPEFLPKQQPLQLCPGFVCIWGGKRCISQSKRCNREVDCLGGEDEVGCIYNFMPDVGSAKNISTTESDYFLKNKMTESVPVEVVTTESTMENADDVLTAMTQHEDDSMAQQHNNNETDTKTNFSEIVGSNHALANFKKTPLLTEKSLTNESFIPEFLLGSKRTMFSQIENETDEVTTLISDIDTNSAPQVSVSVANHTEVSTTTLDDILNSSMLDDKLNTTFVSTALTILPTNTTAIIRATTTLATDTTAIKTHSFEVTTSTTQLHNSTTTSGSTSGTTTESNEDISSNTKVPNVPGKFICKIIPQVIGLDHQCDRISDCEDGTDEQNCTCKDYLKGSLNILICDGKTDCEDLTDEEDCGTCKTDEFLCPLSKTCISLTKRCDGVSDCKFHEDENHCFALTNGKDVHFDANNQPQFNNEGIFSKNTHGVWRIVCAEETSFNTHNAKTAAEICALLDFNGVTYYTTTVPKKYEHIIPIDPDIETETSLPHLSDANISDRFPKHKPTHSRRLRIENTKENCVSLYLKCVAKLNKTQPVKTLSAGEALKPLSEDLEIMEPTVITHNKPNVFIEPAPSDVLIEKKVEIMDKLEKILHIKPNISIMVNDKLHTAIEELHWPWLVDIYRNGELWCLGVLVDKHWVLVHESCQYGIRYTNDYIAALLGGGKSKQLPHKSLNEQIRRVDCTEVVPKSDVILFHLEKPVHLSHFVMPTFLPDMNQYNKTVQPECISVLHEDKFGRIKTVAITEHKNDKLCNMSKLFCFQLLESKPSEKLLRDTALSAEDVASVSEEFDMSSFDEKLDKITRSLSRITTCTQFGNKNIDATISPIDQGILICREEKTGWYPTALFGYNNTNCSSFNQPFAVRTLESVYNVIQNITDNSMCSAPRSQPFCGTYRCPLGVCLTSEQICNKKEDCHDGSDETEDICREFKKECKTSEIKCRSTSECISKSKFCDHKADCEDLTDEPTICSCFTYLKATDPSKICDGIRNCYDKSDESPALCNCTEKHYKCGKKSNECIPRDFVCDGEPDCPNGEDERYCFGIEKPNIFSLPKNMQTNPIYYTGPAQYGQVIEQSYGIWHTKCFPKSTPPNTYEVKQICKKLGYSPYRHPQYRIIDDAANEVIDTNELPDQRGRTFGNDSLIGKYRTATKAVIVSKFSPLYLNNDLTLFLKPSRPIAELVRWNATDSSNCYRLEIKCA
ncbi:serine protease nudel [Teleopsis dalmanni]|uniref:serine protease nudel n=1 Tax=Teleopsis dalmanni TaxID=139649 RepID=UPI0018CD497F|nr:serine protease nudel [Teleopsis dalmanni]